MLRSRRSAIVTIDPVQSVMVSWKMSAQQLEAVITFKVRGAARLYCAASPAPPGWAAWEADSQTDLSHIFLLGKARGELCLLASGRGGFCEGTQRIASMGARPATVTIGIATDLLLIC